MSQPHKFDDVVFCTDSKLTRYRRHTRAVVWRMSYRHALRFQDVSSAAAASVSALAFETMSFPLCSRFLNTILNSWCQNNLRLGNNLELFCKTRHSWTITIGYSSTKLILRRPNSVHWHYVYLFSNSILLSFECILADVLTVQCCVCCLSSVTCCIVAKRCILEQKLLYWQPIGSRIQEIDWYQNQWPWPLFRGRIKVMSTMAWHSTLNISETVRDRGLVSKDHNRKWHGLSDGHVIDDVTWPQRSCETVRLAILATAWLLVYLVLSVHCLRSVSVY